MILTTLAQSRDTRHTTGVRFRCGDCRKTKPVQTSGGTGYGYYADRPDAPLVCYECCGNRDRQEMTDTGRATLYLDLDKRELTNWPGTLRFTVLTFRVGRHNIGGVRHDVWFTGPDGKRWHGVCVGRYTQLTRCRRTK